VDGFAFSASGGLRPFSEEKGLKNLKRLFNPWQDFEFLLPPYVTNSHPNTGYEAMPGLWLGMLKREDFCNLPAF